MATEQKFKTKAGFCHVLPDKIVLTRDGVVGHVSELIVGNKIYQVLSVYGIISIVFLYQAYTKFVNKDWIVFICYLIIGVFLIFSIARSAKLSATPIIERDRIRKIEFKQAKKFLTRSYFKIDFEQKNGKIKTRLIILPGSLSGGEEETKKALEIMKNTGLL